MKEISKIIFFTLILTVTDLECAKILAFFPIPSISHQVVFRPLTQALAKRGHEVVVITTDPSFPNGQAPTNLTEIDVHDISYERWNDLLKHHNGKKEDLIFQIKLMFKSIADILDEQMDLPQVKNFLSNKDKKYFDLIILEAWNRPLLGITHKFDAPVIVISSFGAVSLQYNLLGAPIHPLVYPTPGMQRLYNLTLFEKGLELFKGVAMEYIMQLSEDYDLNIARKHFGSIQSFEDLRKKIKMMFLNEHPLWADNHPVPPSIIYIGGIHLSKSKELPLDLKTYLDSSKQGVIYVSFGTNVKPSDLSPEKIQIFINVFSNLPYNILWKWDKDELPGKSENIKISKWFPQFAVLKHPNVKLFITQGGLQSTDETIDAEVPPIGIPMLADQWYNVEKYVRHKIGLQLDITSFNEEDLKKSIEKVLADKSYKENISRLRTLMREYHIKPLDLAVYWAEHLIKYGGDHLQSPAANMSWVEYYEVKLLIIILGILAIILIPLLFALKRLVGLLLQCRLVLKLKTN